MPATARKIESPLQCETIRVLQGSEEWQSYRAGRITASRLGDVVARKGTKRRSGYIAQLLRELETGEPVDSQDAWYFERGRVLEPFAIGAYEWKYDCQIERDLVCIHPTYEWFSCSPDGLVFHGDHLHGIEVKCRFELKRYLDIVRKVKAGKVERDYMLQIQASMMITGLREWSFVNYYRDEKRDDPGRLSVYPVHYDEGLCRNLEEQILAFRYEVMSIFHGRW